MSYEDFTNNNFNKINWYGILNISNWNLFGIWDLEIVIF